MRKYLLIIAFLGVAACEPEATPRPWPENLDPFMLQQGYTLDAPREIIYKNGYALWYDQRQCSRFCEYSYLGPGELYVESMTDFFNAYNAARAEYVTNVASKIGVIQETKQNAVK